MSTLVYRIATVLCQVLARVPIGTNLGLLHLLFALMSGRFLASRGAVFPALAALGLPDDAVRRSEAALVYGRFDSPDWLDSWQRVVREEAQWQPVAHEGIRPVPCDLTAFFRPHLSGLAGKHYQSSAGKALPALTLALAVRVGDVGRQRLGVPSLLLRRQEGQSESALQQQAVEQVGARLANDEALIVDAGFPVADLLDAKVVRFLARDAQNATFRRNSLPAYKGKGRRAEWGDYVRPLARTYGKRVIAATPPDATVTWQNGNVTVRADLYENLTLSTRKPGATLLRCMVIHDPRYPRPLVLTTNLRVSAQALWGLYKERWAIEQLPLAAKQMLGAERAFVFGQESRWRLPELALLAGNVLSYVAATSQPVACGFWDRCARPTCGRLRRVLSQVHFSDLPVRAGQVCKKNSVTAHLPKGVRAHRRTKAAQSALAGA
jgi:hypothetical protein